MVITSRNSGTISVIDTDTDTVTGTHALPPGAKFLMEPTVGLNPFGMGYVR